MNKSKKCLTLKSLMGFITLGFMSSTAMANDDVYSFVALDISKLENNIFESENYINFSYSPSITIGFAKDYQLYDNWLLTNSVGIRGQQASFYSTNKQEVNEYGEVKKIGLIAGTRLHYLGLNETVIPFVEMEAGINNTNLSHQNNKDNQWQTDYKIATGLEFITSKDTSLSISLGYSDNNF